MLNIDISRLAAAIVRQELVGQGRDDEALYLSFGLRLSASIARKDFELGIPAFLEERKSQCSRGLHLLYHCRPMHSYITVFSGVTDSPLGRLADVKEWKHEITHDSGWRDIGIFSSIYFDMADTINNELNHPLDRAQSQIAPKDMQQFNTFPRDKIFSWVPVEVQKASGHHYEKVVKILT